MKASMTTLVAVLTIGFLGLTASSALACHGGGFGGGYGGYSSNYYPSTEYVREVAVQAPIFAPGHSLIIVLPGDSWFSICSREYGTSGVWSRVAEFNGMPQNLPLTVGMQLRLPVINPNGSLSLSSAPAMFAQGFNGGLPQGIQQSNLPQGFAQGGMPQGGQFGQPNGPSQGNGFAPQQGQMGQPQGQQGPIAPPAPGDGSPNNSLPGQPNAQPGLTNGQPNGQPTAPNVGPSNRPLPSIMIGSIMAIGGQQLGDNRGTVRLIINGSPVALEIVEWNASGAKVKIPADLPAGLQAQIEILRADGSIVTKDQVQLAAGQNLAAANR